jgi:hypothetical protein
MINGKHPYDIHTKFIGHFYESSRAQFYKQYAEETTK